VKLFDIKELQEKEEKPDLINDQNKMVLRFMHSHMERVENIKNLIGRLPGESEMLFLESTKSFNAFTFIPYLIKYAGAIDELFVATYTINSRICNSLVKWLDKGMIKHLHVYISDSIKHRMPKVVDLLEIMQRQRQEQIQITYAWTHKKVTCVRIGGDHYVVEGSGNWSENAAEEQYLFTKSKELYEFRRPAN